MELLKKCDQAGPKKCQTNERLHAHFVNSVFEKISSIGISCFLHHAAVTLRTKTGSNQNEQERGMRDNVPGIEIFKLVDRLDELLQGLIAL